MISRTFSILFFIRKQKESKENAVEKQNKKEPIYIRITVNGKRTELSAKREVDPTKWNRHAGRAYGTKEEIKTLNAYLNTLQRKLQQVHQEVIEAGKPYTADTIKNRFLGIGEDRPRMLLEIIQQHNDSIKKLIGLDYSRPTWVKYNTTQKHVADFLAWKYGKEDIPIKELNYEFITDFDFYLKSEKRIDVNTNAKYIKNLKKIIRECVAKDWLQKDPFMAYKLKTRKVERECLSESELQVLENKKFSMERLNVVRDLFLFSCYTGLSFIDASQLTPGHIVTGIDGEKWINTFPSENGYPVTNSSPSKSFDHN